MKTTRKLLMPALLIACLLPSLAFAGGGKTKTNKSSSTSNIETAITPLVDQVEVRIIKPQDETVRVKIYTEGGAILYIDRVKKDNEVAITYDISQFPPGSYRFDVIKDRKVISSKTVEKETEATEEE